MSEQAGRAATSTTSKPEWDICVRAWRERLADEKRAQVVATNAAREAAQRAAAVLVEQFGCKRVYLFGSLTGMGSSPFGPRSDVDLAVEGLPVGRYLTALAALESVFRPETPFEVVRLEDALPSLVARVQSTGEVLANGAAIRGAGRRFGS